MYRGLMNYPIWEPAIANSTLIAVVGILHVFVSHFAIGGGLYLVVMETLARRRNDIAHLAYIQRHSRFFVLTTLVFGAVTGVGIWVTIGLIHPIGTKWLINNFVWGWATEWVFFFIEITAAMLYLYGWRRLTARAHLAIGWIYFAAAWLSLVVINCILTFMLTPGRWLTTGNFWDGFLNPGYIPALIFRTFICIVLAGLFAALTGAREKDIALKVRMLRANGFMVLIALLLAMPSGWWYFRTLPGTLATTVMIERVPLLAFQVMLFSAGLLFFLTLLGTVLFPRRAGYVSAAILLLCALMSMGGFEWAREAIRKPFIIRDFLYSNGLLAVEAANLPAQNPLPVTFSTGDRGRDLYLKGCRSCHTISGYHGLAPHMAGRSEENIAALIPRLQFFREQMPPFPGNQDDVAALAKHLKSIAGSDPLAAPDLTDQQKAEIVFARHCAGCHTMNGFRPLGASFSGTSASDAADVISNLSDLTEQMPPFIGTDEEKRLLIEYLTGGSK